MYDADYESYMQELNDEAIAPFITKKSGEKAQHSDGVVRDTDKGKPRFDLLFPKGVPFDDQLMTRTANLYERGGAIYGYRNWEASRTEETLEHHEAALMRHVIRFLTGVDDGEDHAAAVVWNVNAVDLTRRNIKQAEEITEAVNTVVEESDWGITVLSKTEPEPDLDAALKSIKSYTFPYIGKDTAFSGRYYAKQIFAGCYEEAKMLFDKWYGAQPYYNAAPEIPDAPEIPAEPEWNTGDVLEEVTLGLDGKPYVWVYQFASDVWLYQSPDGKTSPDSARSYKRLLSNFGPLRCTKGSNVGRIVDGT